MSLGRNSEATQAFQEALRIDPNFDIAKEGAEALTQPHRTLYLQSWTLAEAGKFERAKRQFLRAREQAPARFQWKIDDGLAWLKLYQKDLENAEDAFRRILQKCPGAYLSRKGLGYVALERDDFSVAAQHIFTSVYQELEQVLTSYTVPAVRFLAAEQFDANFTPSPASLLFGKSRRSIRMCL